MRPSDVMGCILSGQQSKYRSRHCANVDLADRGGEEIDNILVGHRNHRFSIDLNDAVVHANTTALCYPTTQKATNYSVLNTEAQLELLVRPSD